MTKEEKELLKELIQSDAGFRDVFSLGQNQKKTTQLLIAGGMAEEFQYKNISCYRATGKGYLVFEPFWKRAWVFFTDDLAKVLSIIATILSIISIAITLLK